MYLSNKVTNTITTEQGLLNYKKSLFGVVYYFYLL